ncbi:MAG TPA: hypothetical protein VMB75_08205, partial [Rhodocyclaceae bacterium]|nr:hypothetical protein [Rhodocyclaceae bacterium]
MRYPSQFPLCMRHLPIGVALATASSLAVPSAGAEEAATVTLPEVSVSASKPAAPANLSNTIEGVAAKQID